MSIPGHAAPLDESHCSLCYEYHHNPRYRHLVDGDGDEGQEERQPVPCVHLGDRVPGREVHRLRLDVRREWYRCKIGKGQPAGFAVRCLTCIGKCESFIPTVTPDVGAANDENEIGG